MTVGTRSKVREFNAMLKKRFSIKTVVVGDAESEVQEARILNRLIRWTPDGFEIRWVAYLRNVAPRV